jgi:MSHA pilin protein MshA
VGFEPVCQYAPCEAFCWHGQEPGFRLGFLIFYKVNNMKQEQRGFTLIELVMVIVILGVLAAVALPKFVDLSSDAKTAAIQGAAGALSSYSVMNYSAAQVRGTGGTGVIALASSAGASLKANMAGWDGKFVVQADINCATGSAGAGAAGSVTLSYSGGAAANSAVATIICTG